MLYHGSKVDLRIQVGREKLIGLLTDNQQTHNAEHQKAVESYKVMLVKHAKMNLARAENGEHPKPFPEPAPRSYTTEYDRALGMLKLSELEKVSLSAQDYVRFCEDDWDWKSAKTASNNFYSPEVAASFLEAELSGLRGATTSSRHTSKTATYSLNESAPVGILLHAPGDD